MMRIARLASLAASFVSPALAGDFVITVTGTVSSITAPPIHGPYVGTSVGDPVILHVEVLLPFHAQNPNHFGSFGVDGPASSLTIGAATASFSGGIQWLWNDFPVVDGMRLLDAPLVHGQGLSFEFDEPTGTMFTSTDLSQNLGSWPASIFSSHYFALRGSCYLQFAPLQIRISLPPVGTNYCEPIVPNSTGVAGLISAIGTPSIAANDLVLRASGLPSNAFGYFLCSRIQAYSPVAQSPYGVLCVANPIGRFSNQIQSSGATGSFHVAVDNTALPQPSGAVAAVAGETWNFQAWHRDALAGLAVANFTNGLAVMFL